MKRLAITVLTFAVSLGLSACDISNDTAQKKDEASDILLQVDPARFDAETIPCVEVPWLDKDAGQILECWGYTLAEGTIEAGSKELADAVAVQSGGQALEQVCDTNSDTGTVRACVTFSTIPDQAGWSIEAWTVVDPESEQSFTSGGDGAGYYTVTFRRVPWGPDFYRPVDPSATPSLAP